MGPEVEPKLIPSILAAAEQSERELEEFQKTHPPQTQTEIKDTPEGPMLVLRPAGPPPEELFLIVLFVKTTEDRETVRRLAELPEVNDKERAELQKALAKLTDPYLVEAPAGKEFGADRAAKVIGQLPELFRQVKTGEAYWCDKGKLHIKKK